MSGPQKPGPIAAWRRRSTRPRLTSVVRASETRPNCSVAVLLEVGAVEAGCPGLRNPAQLQHLVSRRRLDLAVVVRASETRPNCSIEAEVGQQAGGDVVRASETRPNCSQGVLEHLAYNVKRCPGLRNPAQLQRIISSYSSSRIDSCPGLRNPAQLQPHREPRAPTRPRALSGPQKPGPIAALLPIVTPPAAWLVVRASETRPNCSVGWG